MENTALRAGAQSANNIHITAKVEVTKPFVQEVEIVEKLERLSALNALLDMMSIIL